MKIQYRIILTFSLVKRFKYEQNKKTANVKNNFPVATKQDVYFAVDVKL